MNISNIVLPLSHSNSSHSLGVVGVIVGAGVVVISYVHPNKPSRRQVYFPLSVGKIFT